MSQEIPPPTIAQETLQSLPPHVQKNYVTTNESLSHLLLSFLPEDSEATIQEASKVTPRELLELHHLRSIEARYAAQLPQTTEAQKAFFRDQYQALQSNVQEPERLTKSLALTLVATEKGPMPENITVWDVQRVALLRILKNLQDETSPGIITNLRTGHGKTKVIALDILPTALLVKPHWIVGSLTPVSRTENARRFSAYGELFRVGSRAFTNKGIQEWQQGYPLTALGDKIKANTLQQQSVIFLMRADLGFFIQRNPDILTTVDPKLYGYIKDEIDATDLDEFTDRLVISGPEIALDQVIEQTWNPRAHKEDLTPTLADKPLTREQYQWCTRELTNSPAFQKELEAVRRELAPLTQNPDTLFGITLLRRVMHHYEGLTQQQDQPGFMKLTRRKREKLGFLDKDGGIQQAGEYDLYRRLYQQDIHDEQYDRKKRIPNLWASYFSELFPPNVEQAINNALVLKDHYFIDHGIITPKSAYTGYPQPSREFTPMTYLAIYARESIRSQTEIFLPSVFHDISDSISPIELDAMIATKHIGLTGTALGAVRWFRQFLNLDITAIPPQHEMAVDRTNQYIPVVKATKEDAAVVYVKTIADSEVPILIDAPTPESAQRLFERLNQEFGQTAPHKFFRVLSAQNADQAQTTFELAGQKNMITIVVRMAGREVDIPAENLHLLALEPQEFLRNEEQFVGRTGRADKAGVYRCLVSPKDRVFKTLPEDQKKLLERALSQGNQRILTTIIREQQERNQYELEQTNAIAFMQRYPIVFVRKRFAALPESTRQIIKYVWKDLLDYADTRSQSLQFDYNVATKPLPVRARIWQHHIAQLFTQIERRAEHTTLKDLDQFRMEVSMLFEAAKNQDITNPQDNEKNSQQLPEKVSHISSAISLAQQVKVTK